MWIATCAFLIYIYIHLTVPGYPFSIHLFHFERTLLTRPSNVTIGQAYLGLPGQLWISVADIEGMAITQEPTEARFGHAAADNQGRPKGCSN